MRSLRNGAERSSQGEAATRLGCRAEPDQGDESMPNVAAGEMAGVGTSLTLHAVNVRFSVRPRVKKHQHTRHPQLNTPFHDKDTLFRITGAPRPVKKMHGTSKHSKKRQYPAVDPLRFLS
jgi:hypothetical protein